MTPVDRVLDGLDAVRRTGSASWMARCPAHQDRTPSLSIREGSDGRVLLHCFAGCGAIDVLDVLDLDWPDLYPPRLDTHPETRRRPRRVAPPIPARDALEILDQEALTVAVIASRLARGEPVARYEKDLTQATTRIGAIRSAWMEAPR